MTEGRELAAVLDGRLDDRLVSQVGEPTADALPADEAQKTMMKIVELAEHDPSGARKALWALRGNAGALEGLEHGLPLSPSKATLALGGAIQLASTELASANPDLRGRIPELMRWLEGSW